MAFQYRPHFRTHYNHADGRKPLDRFRTLGRAYSWDRYDVIFMHSIKIIKLYITELEEDHRKKRIFRGMISMQYYAADTIHVLTRHNQRNGFLGYSAPLSATTWTVYLQSLLALVFSLLIGLSQWQKLDFTDVAFWSVLFHYDDFPSLEKMVQAFMGGMSDIISFTLMVH